MGLVPDAGGPGRGLRITHETCPYCGRNGVRTAVEMRPTVEFVPMEDIYDPDVALKAYLVIDMRPKDK
ncbi:MAG: hypothetical protein KKE79_04585 [Actinobacteria bacterium]|nr:hypothetical protein [Actinomycetota bacterium]MBU4240206.1 hypothetical protein [Actinomycetota bacterium]MBU4302158.1 hypothetical protein [Actinomycetota bacterium]MBU4489894.1 hypothetical protein [Actinomycetota bacterium]